MSMFDVLWLLIFLPPIGWEVYAIRNKTEGDTLSERLRIWWRVDSLPGKVAFSVACIGLCAWLIPHIVA